MGYNWNMKFRLSVFFMLTVAVAVLLLFFCITKGHYLTTVMSTAKIGVNKSGHIVNKLAQIVNKSAQLVNIPAQKVNKSAQIVNIPAQIVNKSAQIVNIPAQIDNKSAEGFYRYVLTKGINITKLSDGKFRITHLKWSCDINTTIARNFRKRNLSWKDMFETRLDVLYKKTILSLDTLRKQMGVLPKDGTPITLVARQENVTIPKHDVIIRLNQHGPLDAPMTMIMTWGCHVKTISMSARKQPNKTIIRWTHYKPYGHGRSYGLWNISNPIVVPEDVWGFEDLKYYKGPLFFMKGGYFFGRFADCNPGDGIGLGAINRVSHLKGDISTLGFSTRISDYNKKNDMRFKLMSHALPWAYFVVKE